MQAIASANPVNWALEAVRGTLTASHAWHATLVNGGGLAALAALTVWLSTRTFRAYQRTV
jgi:ABC-2 type transport system permease protein